MTEDARVTPIPAGAIVSETGAGRFQVSVSAGGKRFLADEPVAVGGLGSGPNPYDLLASALGACTAMTLRLYAQHKGLPLQHVKVAVTHSRPDLQARDQFSREIELEGPLDDDQRARLLQIADRCPVHLTLMRGSEVRTRLVEAPRLEFDGAGGVSTHARLMDEACAS
jgi:putative redox protein